MLSLTNLTYLYKHLLMCFTFSMHEGERLAILGPSGSGKSTLLNLIAGFLPASSGKLELNAFNHRATPPSQRPLSILFQENNLFSHLTIAQNIGLGLHPGLKLNHQQKQELQNIAQDVGLREQLQNMPYQLSGGQRQCAALARCLVRKQPILLLDEPFSALDPALHKEMLGLVDNVCRERHITLLMVSHSIEDAADIAGRSLLIVDGQVYWDGSTVLLKTGTVPEAKVLGIISGKISHT